MLLLLPDFSSHNYSSLNEGSGAQIRPGRFGMSGRAVAFIGLPTPIAVRLKTRQRADF
jgi:hypothetical protein